MRNLPSFILALVFLAGILPQAHAKPSKSKQAGKERLVLMPLRVGEADKSRQAAMETALVQGLQQKYEVFSGEQVAQKAKAIFLKESRTAVKKDCDETRCMQDIAEAFQAELIATANVSKQEDGYFLALSIQNIFDNKVVYSNSIPCQNCNAYQAVEKLKELSGSSAVVAESEPVISVKQNDPESALWNEVQKGNSTDDYNAYLAQYPKGKYVSLARSRSKKLQEQEAAEARKQKAEAAAEAAQQEQGAWESANSSASEAGYAEYLDSYPKGQYATLATARIAKLKKEAALLAAQAPKVPQAGKTFKDCPDCPEMVVIPAGSFKMGSNSGAEAPAHRVSLKSFALGKTEVTQGQWKTIMGSNPSRFTTCGDNCPVEQVSWDDAKIFIKKLTAQTGKQYRLPSEAEWEYACRAGEKQKYCGSDDINKVAWYGAYTTPPGNSAKTTNPVAIKQANAFGLYDMSGNVFEWVEDSHHSNYSDAPTDGSAWEGESKNRMIRGGSWQGDTQKPTAANRVNDAPTLRSNLIGFRLARMLP